VLGLLYWRERKKHSGEKSDLQDEMDTIETAWAQSAAALASKDEGDEPAASAHA
jgi:hypothetical protein